MKQGEDRLNLTFMALSDPTRRAILAQLSGGESTVQELSKPFDISAPAITKHLKVLEKAGLISRSKEAQWRPCRLKTEALKEAANWIGDYKKFWEESFDRLDTYLKKLTGKKRGNRNGRKK